MKIAVIGGGVAGLGAAWSLARRHRVTLYESADRLGGHANTVDVTVAGQEVAVDTGFIVYNEANYPQLTRLFAELGVATEPSVMSFSVSIDDGRLEYAGNAAGLLAQPGNLLRRDYWRMLTDLLRFNREAPALLAAPAGSRQPTLGAFLRENRYSTAFAELYLLPMAAAIWSSTLDDIADYPVRSLVQFFANHGLLQLTGRPLWRTVGGGSRAYVRRLARSIAGEIRLGRPIVAVERGSADIRVRDAAGDCMDYDQVVFASHADQTLQLLGGGASDAERRVLGAFRYQSNRAVLHRDPRMMPRRGRAWASWNYAAAAGTPTASRLSVTYWMNRLQNLATPEPLFVSLNPMVEPAADRTYGTFLYDHPQYDAAALTAQRKLPALQGLGRSWFCGSYCGYGFHEDALQSGLAVATALGAAPPWLSTERAGTIAGVGSGWPLPAVAS